MLKLRIYKGYIKVEIGRTIEEYAAELLTCISNCSSDSRAESIGRCSTHVTPEHTITTRTTTSGSGGSGSSSSRGIGRCDA